MGKVILFGVRPYRSMNKWMSLSPNDSSKIKQPRFAKMINHVIIGKLFDGIESRSGNKANRLIFS